ncbi:arylformamidase [Evansella tamaricis]|uniref:Kynurenine formamidase n=1 Tax=Evansella tamaricis TaxID=2069301 RepID=A0ABS6JKA3_9BACI|nr:arylformamidase [Evansella tamaricis]
MVKGEWIDITQPLTSRIANWPGDTPFSYEVVATKAETGSVNIGKITTSTHIGTHIDAPFHFKNDGEKVSELDINIYIGMCRIIDVSGYSQINKTVLCKANITGVTRILLKTSVPNNAEQFPSTIPYITEEGANYLGENGVKLVGVDVPSVDPLDSKELVGHHSLHKNGIHILENVMLDNINPGDYDLIALPLAIEEGDGSPVRAVLRPVSLIEQGRGNGFEKT